jgi:hypothetical protein
MPHGDGKRSPSYPAINLEDAIERTRTLWRHEKKNAVTASALAEYWQYSLASSGLRLTTAALKKYGLIEPVGNKKSGEVRVSDLATRIILDTRDDSPERDDAIREAALNPEIHRTLWERWGGELPPDASLRTFLTLNLGFNDATVDDFIEEYKKTVSFARLREAGKTKAGGADRLRGQSDEDDEAGSDSDLEEGGTSQQAVLPAGDIRAVIRELTIPLIGGGLAVLKAPLPLSDDNYALVTAFLQTMKPALVAPPSRPAAAQSLPAVQSPPALTPPALFAQGDDDNGTSSS